MHLPLVAMSPRDVLAAIRDSYRHAEQLDPESEPGVNLTFESTVAVWRMACDLVGTRALGHGLNKWFDLRATDDEWRAILEPANHASLREVCAFIAVKGAPRPALRPFRVAGVECAEAGAFLTLRSLLAAAGVPVARARPSTPLAPWAGVHVETLITITGKLAPGALPIPHITMSGWIGRGVTACGLSVVLMAGIPLAQSWWYSALFAAVFAVGVASWTIGDRRTPVAVDFGGLRTLGDLARHLVQHRAPST